jgi:hypothetical protein
MDNSSNDIEKLGHRIAELQATQLLVSAQMRALMLLCARIWSETGVRMPGDKPVEQVLHTMTDEQREYILSSFADTDPKGAAQLKEIIEKSLRGQNPFR